MRGPHQRRDEVEPEDVLRTRGGEGRAVLLADPVELGGELRRGAPGPDGLLLDREDVAAVLEAEPEVVGHHGEVARGGNQRNVGACLERTTSIRLDDDPVSRPKPATSPRSRPTLSGLRATAPTISTPLSSRSRVMIEPIAPTP